MYLGKSNITVQNVEKVVLAAEFLNHAEMKSECENVMLNILDVSRLMSFHKLSQKADLYNLKTACLHLAKDKFTEVAHTKWFLALTTDEAVEYLQADDLNVATEDDVLHAIIRYINNSNEAGPVSEQYITRLFSCSRLKFCRRPPLESLSIDETILGPLRLKILEFLQHGRHGEGKARESYSAAHSASAASEELPKASVPGTDSREKLPLPPRATRTMTTKASAKVPSPPVKVPVASPLKTKEEVLIVGGIKTGNFLHGNIVSLDKDPGDCILTQAPICAKASNSSVCANKDALFVSGGYERSTQHSISKVHKFSLTDRRWVDLPDLPFPVDCHGSAYVSDKLHTFGGRYRENDQTKHLYSSVNVLDLASLSWAEGQSLPIAVETPGIAAVDENIYTVGGHSGKEWSRQTVKLNTQTGAITQCQTMPKGGCIAYSTVAVNRYIYALACNSFLQYITSDQWTKLTMPLEPYSRPAMVLQNNHLIMLGGFEKDWKDPNDVIQKYDLSSKTWSLEACKMPLQLHCHWAFVMDIPQAK